MSSNTATTANNNKAIFTDAEVSFYLFDLKIFIWKFILQTDAFQGLDVSRLSTEDIIARSRLLDNEVKVRSNLQSIFFFILFFLDYEK